LETGTSAGTAAGPTNSALWRAWRESNLESRLATVAILFGARNLLPLVRMARMARIWPNGGGNVSMARAPDQAINPVA
jgi:hypothetical protein